MRNTPLWRPQPSPGSATDAPDEPVEKNQRLSAVALMVMGLTIAVGVSAVGAFAFLEGDPVEPALAAAETPVTPAKQPKTGLPQLATREPLVGRVPAASPSVPLHQPAQTETIDVAVAQTELDVARLEEMTGMIEAAAPVPAPPVPEPRVTAAIIAEQGAVDGLRATQPVPGTEKVVVQPEQVTSEDGTETASIQPDEATAPVEEKPTDQQAAAAPALPPLSATKVSRYVNLRSGPADESRVVVVVPAGATVQAQSNCGWCVVTYKGQRGYIYKSFLVRGGKATASNGAAPSVNKKKPGLY